TGKIGDIALNPRHLCLKNLVSAHLQQPIRRQRMPAQRMSFGGTVMIPIPTRGFENALRMGLTTLRFKSRPVEWQRDLIEKCKEVLVAEFRLFFLFSSENSVHVSDAAAPIAPKQKFVIGLLDHNFLIGKRCSVKGERHCRG